MPPTAVVLLGVCGCGKSTVGLALAQRLGWDFVEGDDVHPPANRLKMAAGQPLDDADRAPWLAALARELAARAAAARPVVLSCSALKPAYRRALESGAARQPNGSGNSEGDGSSTGGRLAFVLLEPSAAELQRRLRAREAAGAHFMPASLLPSQLAALEYDPAELFAHFAGERFPAEKEIVEELAARLEGNAGAAVGAAGG